MSPTGKSTVENAFYKMFTVTSRLTFAVSREDDGVPVVCIVDHPAVKDFQAQKYLEVQCKYRRLMKRKHFQNKFISLKRKQFLFLEDISPIHLEEPVLVLAKFVEVRTS